MKGKILKRGEAHRSERYTVSVSPVSAFAEFKSWQKKEAEKLIRKPLLCGVLYSSIKNSISSQLAVWDETLQARI